MTNETWESWLGPRRSARLAERYGTPFYGYSARVLRNRCRALRRAFPGALIQYAMKANSNPALLRMIRGQKLGVDTVSAWEVQLARECGFRPRAIVYSGSNPSVEELRAVHRAGAMVNLDALSALHRYGKLFRGAPVSLRLNLEIGGGHHPHVVTAGPDSKFGLSPEELPEARAIAARYGLKVIGLHQHIGSGVFELALWLEAMDALLEIAAAIPGIERIDAGGGFGVPYRPEEQAIELGDWGRAVTARMAAFNAQRTKKARLVLEPGRFVVCEAGVLVARVTTVKRTRDRVFVGVDSGMHHLIRPALYQSWHPIDFYPHRTGTPERVFVVGPICESGDVIAEERMMPVPEEGDLLVVGNAGAYGYAMASHYNLRARPAEVLVDGDRAREVRKRETYRDVVRARDV
ncbi:MAG: diaminopimelate decarboxylase [Myxococcales bacterium]|nr:diaminopimelate decarboxylase [Myxococcales bacterium]